MLALTTRAPFIPAFLARMSGKENTSILPRRGFNTRYPISVVAQANHDRG